MPAVNAQDHFATKADLAGIEGRLDHFATKADLAQAEGRLLEKIADAENRLNDKIANLRADLERNLRTMTWQLVAAIIAAAGLVVAIMRLWPPG